jgi:hypothetical protein
VGAAEVYETSTVQGEQISTYHFRKSIEAIISNLQLQISKDSYSWEDAREHWQKIALERRQLMLARLAAVPPCKTTRCYLLELPVEIREQILSEVLHWDDLKCVEQRGKFGQNQWHDHSLSELPFWFIDCPPVLALSRQILCEAVSILMRRPMVLAPLKKGEVPKNRMWANQSVIWPMARMLKLYEMASWGGRLQLMPKLVIDAPDVLGEHLWAPLREVFVLWRQEIVYDFLRIDIQHGEELAKVLSNGEIIAPRSEELVEGFPGTLVIRSLEWAR